MVHQAGRASDEYPVDARDLNQSFIGMTVGYNSPTGTVYGRIAAVRLAETRVQVWLDSVVAGDMSPLDLEPAARLYFARTTGDWQLRETVDKILDHLKSRA